MRILAIALLALPAACAMGGGSAALLGSGTVLTVASDIVEPSVAAQISVKMVCDAEFVWKLLHPAASEPHWEAVVEAACAKDPQSFAGAGVDLLEAAVMLKLEV